VTGVLPNQTIAALIDSGQITIDAPLADGQIQPASLDLRLGTKAWRVRASFLAGNGRRVADRLQDFEMHQIDLSQGAVLEKGCVYVVPIDGRACPAPEHHSGRQRQKLNRTA
jgi:dCTP deaminase